MKAVVYNDTSNAFGMIHFGCRLVMATLYDLLDEAGIDVIGRVTLDDARANRLDHDLLKRADLVIANGEGSYHHNRRPDFLAVAKQYPTALINTVYQANSGDPSVFKYIAARESRSRDEIAHKAPCDLVPDVIFCSKYLASVEPSGGPQVSVQHGRGNASPTDIGTLQDSPGVVPAIAGAGSVVTCSFHAGCVAAYYGKPVKLLESNTHKMQGLAADLGIPFGEMGTPNPEYAKAAPARIKAMIERLKTCH